MKSALLDQLKRKIRANPEVFELLVSIILLRNRLIFEASTWPLPFGRSRMDRLRTRRQTARAFASKFELESQWNSLVEAAAKEDDLFFQSMCNDTSREIPISFSWPGELAQEERNVTTRKRVFSQVFPGKPYSFEDYEAYFMQYRESQIGVSFKKAGWDCFRHLEILNAGCLMYMPDADQIPRFAMSHYPKNLLLLAKRRVEAGLPIDKRLHDAIQARFRNRLTSVAMASFILHRLAARDKRAVFLDLDLQNTPDYLSVMTYVGLKRILGKDGCISPLGAQPIFDDWGGEARGLHGLGFGYTRVLPAQMRSELDGSQLSVRDCVADLGRNDFVFVANVSVRPELAKLVDEILPPEIGRAFIWGGDRPPGRAERAWLRKLRGHILFREIY